MRIYMRNLAIGVGDDSRKCEVPSHLCHEYGGDNVWSVFKAHRLYFAETIPALPHKFERK